MSIIIHKLCYNFITTACYAVNFGSLILDLAALPLLLRLSHDLPMFFLQEDFSPHGDFPSVSVDQSGQVFLSKPVVGRDLGHFYFGLDKYAFRP